MEKRQKVWIRGVDGRSDEVINELVKRGAHDTHIYGGNPDLIYFIDEEDLSTTFIRPDIITAKEIMKNYKEIKLGPKPFEPFDKILFRRDSTSCWNAMEYWYFVRHIESFSPGQIIPYNEETKHLLNTTEDYE